MTEPKEDSDQSAKATAAQLLEQIRYLADGTLSPESRRAGRALAKLEGFPLAGVTTDEALEELIRRGFTTRHGLADARKRGFIGPTYRVNEEGWLAFQHSF